MSICVAELKEVHSGMRDRYVTPHTNHRSWDLHHWISGLTSPALDTTNLRTVSGTQQQPSIPPHDCRMVRSTAEGLASLGNSSTIVLFTPVIAPAGSAKATNKTNGSADPFEPLGRALSRHHKRVRHVPYVPNIGFTETHDAFLSQADAVIVVICEPDAGKHEALANQVDFAEATRDGLEESSCAGSLILIQCGDARGTFWPDLSQFDNTLKCQSYDSNTAQQIARKLVESKK
ncbi:hypothetical protein CLAFUW4_03739 [Fulvia fulva]|uniref:Uncharacterized protein n=1 Tax=Passalora fulva TaxID=5499 RepID=A0A9Q8LCU5_PASFU|nr:uncharacterized protein CLAFUR5_03714 [Fulvia fulva]KAK4632067.1 hypothetical protein CLAFUR4_03727 [Fulvia fulva]KAK4633048.1 hypothetical protein CLAFUR0_03728 [Fulvia fulva]UJO14378.1 hypothetical protein CLAFUR5_03714 [Fulvia fulva]WPV11749.1 hypothetical protein CLAFUW4_03739 [Fulvia fulva]WPV26356.1 hypothetical protein CLAFUW7_03731 [Fulvia fulva]